MGFVLNAGAADSGIGGRVTVSGATGITFNAPVNLLADTTLTVNGQPELKPVLVSQTQNNRVIPVGSSILANTAVNAIPDIGLTRVAASSGEQFNRSTVAGAGDSIDRGQSVVIDLSPGNAKAQK